MESKLNRTRRAQKETRGETRAEAENPPFSRPIFFLVNFSPAPHHLNAWNRLSDYVGSLHFNPACAGLRRLKGKAKRQFSCLKLVDRKDLYSLKVN